MSGREEKKWNKSKRRGRRARQKRTAIQTPTPTHRFKWTTLNEKNKVKDKLEMLKGKPKKTGKSLMLRTSGMGKKEGKLKTREK